MNRVRRSVFARSFVLPLALLLWLSACQKWVPLEPPVAQAMAQEEPGTVRVTLEDSTKMVLQRPRVSGDSLIAVEDGKEPATVALSFEDMVRIEERKANVLATVGLVIGIPFLALFALAAGCAAAGGCIEIWD
jgi:hypothetical protein